MASQPKTLLTPEEYLEIERRAETKSEYYEGEMFAMAGAGANHNQLVWNLIAQLDRHIRSRGCHGYPSDMRVRVSATGLYVYPDVLVVCGEPQFADAHRDTLLNPTLIVEVLSPSTEAYDRGRKFEHYQSIEPLNEYVLVASDRVHVDRFIRQADGQWLLTAASGPEESIELKSLGCRLAVGDLYEKVDLTAQSA